VRSDRTGRVIVTVPVPRACDPDQVAQIVRTCALAHREVMSEPAPRVLFKRIAENTIDFDLVCFVDEIESCARVSSDLTFAIYRALREAGIGQPGPEAKAIMAGLASIEQSLEHLAEAVDGKRAPAPTSPVLPLPPSAGQPIRTRKPRTITP
jgi:small-conductance mechanosensitive channel